MVGKNKLDERTFCISFDKFGEEAVVQTLNDVYEGLCSAETLEKDLYLDETKEEYPT